MEKMYRVLLANSSEDFSTRLTSVLQQSQHYTVVGTASDGVRAIELLREVQPEILVVDTMLPQADGIAVLKAASALEHKPMLLVLADFMTEFCLQSARFDGRAVRPAQALHGTQRA